jgi:5'-nucleotidase/UDP-sugar diphosphatase
VTFGTDPADLETRATALKAAGADLVVLLSHTGIDSSTGGTTDATIARDAPDIDIILGGHSHDALTEPRTVGHTLIIQAGSYMRDLAELTVDVSDAGVSLVDYQLHPLDDTIVGDADVQTMVEGWIDAIDAGVLASLGVTYREPVAETAFDVATPHGAESTEGDLVTDTFREMSAAVTPADPVLAAFESDGVIRDDLLAGSDGVLCFADLFRALPLGVGPDLHPGYPLVSFWVTGADLRAACEVTVSLPGIAGNDYVIQMSGLRCHRNPSGGLMHLIDEVYLGNDVDGYSTTPIDVSGTDGVLYRITTDAYVAGLMSVLEERTYGLLSITPKNADGTDVTDMMALRVDADPATAGVQELKLWLALWTWIQLQPDDDGDGLPEIPARFAAPAGRYF